MLLPAVRVEIIAGMKGLGEGGMAACPIHPRCVPTIPAPAVLTVALHAASQGSILLKPGGDSLCCQWPRIWLAVHSTVHE